MPFKKLDVQEYIDKLSKSDPEFAIAWERSKIEHKILGDLINIRKEKGLSQAELAERSGYKQQTISRIEKNRTNLTLKTLSGLLDALDVDIQFVPRSS
jgi:DNA-binding XRE family transcriptional regulator